MSNIKRTSPGSARAFRRYALPPEELLDTIELAVDDLPRWSVLVSYGRGLRAERHSRLFRLKDVITVRATEGEGGSEASFESTSLTGKFDFGQNRRNLLEILDAIDHELRERS